MKFHLAVSPPLHTPSFIVGYLWSSAQGVATSCSLCVFQAFVWWQTTSLVTSDSKFTCHFACLLSSVWNALFLFQKKKKEVFFSSKWLDFDSVGRLCKSRVHLSSASLTLSYTQCGQQHFIPVRTDGCTRRNQQEKNTSTLNPRSDPKVSHLTRSIPSGYSRKQDVAELIMPLFVSHWSNQNPH